jgi:transcriptional antiterminator RfaH
MPILSAEPTQLPDDLFEENVEPLRFAEQRWWVLHVKPRQEKSLARDLRSRAISFFLPLVRNRLTVRGRGVDSFTPLFAGYLFLLADRNDWLQALATRRVVKPLEVVDQARLWFDLRQIWRLIGSGSPLTPVEMLPPGTTVEIQTGPLAGLRGQVISHASGQRLLVKVDFLQRGASVLLHGCTVVPVNDDI